ncbi:MAG: VOC family protein [Parvularculaceae bacterium]|nr:VOC family protein [Parvularculaceae bacterium]
MEFWFHHGGVSVEDLEAAIDWYDRVLGFKLARRFKIASIPAEVAVLRNGPLHFELFQPEAPAPASAERHVPDEDVKTCGNKHVAFACRDVAGLSEVISQRGGEVLWVKDFGDGRVNSFIRDMEGNLIEFVQFPKFSDEATL